MTFIFISPDRTQLPELPNSHICTDLEQITGADIAISNLPVPVPPTQNLDMHIKARTLFVQIKIGYDILSFDALHNFCARVQKSKIPRNQAILLYVKEHWQDENGLFRIKGEKSFSNMTWLNFRRHQMATIQRGVTIWPENLNDMSDLLQWIEDFVAIYHKMIDEPKKEIYPPRIKPMLEIDDIWQLVEEVSPNTLEYLLMAGFKGFGQKTVNAARKYFQDELPHLPCAGHYFLSALIDMENGKLKHNIPGWGIKRAQALRDILMLPDNVNLGLNGKIHENEYIAGWQHSIDTFADTLKMLAEQNGGKLNLDIVNKSIEAVKKAALIPF